VTHPDEVPVDDALVRELLRQQFPRWADLAVRRLAPGGTDHAIFRLGEDKLARLARRPSAAAQVDKEAAWLPRLAPALPLRVPAPLAFGEPGAGYPFRWSVGRWLDGEPLSRGPAHDPVALATDLARFVRALQTIDATGAPRPGAHNAGRGCPLTRRDAATRAALAELHGRIDVGAAEAAWDRALATSPWAGPPVWIHGDLLAGNLLIEGGRLAAVIDFGCLAAGDPACDLLPAWFLFDGEARAAFRAAMQADAETWARARGWALSVALVQLPYYRDRDPPFAAVAERAITRVLSAEDAR
jgi:aminoglycoside phosphotransferase (APT) family kinase protein